MPDLSDLTVEERDGVPGALLDRAEELASLAIACRREATEATMSAARLERRAAELEDTVLILRGLAKHAEVEQ